MSKAYNFSNTCQIVQFKVTICRWCLYQTTTADTSISPILLRRLLADAFDNSLRSNKSPASALTHKIGKILLSSACVCLVQTPSTNCYFVIVQFDKCTLGYRLLTPTLLLGIKKLSGKIRNIKIEISGISRNIKM